MAEPVTTRHQEAVKLLRQLVFAEQELRLAKDASAVIRLSAAFRRARAFLAKESADA